MIKSSQARRLFAPTQFLILRAGTPDGAPSLFQRFKQSFVLIAIHIFPIFNLALGAQATDANIIAIKLADSHAGRDNFHETYNKIIKKDDFLFKSNAR